MAWECVPGSEKKVHCQICKKVTTHMIFTDGQASSSLDCIPCRENVLQVSEFPGSYVLATGTEIC